MKLSKILKNTLVSSSLIASGLAAIGNPASATTFADNYFGGNPSGQVANSDVLGNPAVFDISHAELSIINGAHYLTIASRSIARGNTEGGILGDLFISSDGYTPFGASPHTSDNASTGEDWEYVLRLENRQYGASGNIPNTGYEQFSKLYEVEQSRILKTSAPVSGSYRANQEFAYSGNGQTFLSSSIVYALEGGDYDLLRFRLPENLIQIITANGGEFGFHWTTVNGNDVIEGKAAVPEPFTALLLGCPLALAYRRKVCVV